MSDNTPKEVRASELAERYRSILAKVTLPLFKWEHAWSARAYDDSVYVAMRWSQPKISDKGFYRYTQEYFLSCCVPVDSVSGDDYEVLVPVADMVYNGLGVSMYLEGRKIETTKK